MNQRLLNRTVLATALLAIVFPAGVAFAQTSGFTYQGRLTDGGTAANGNYDLQFALFDSLSGGTQIGSTQTLNTVAVSNGVFTVPLDFGASSFTGANRFLEISARPSGAGTLITLIPRQQITSTPYSVRSASAANADTATTAANATTATNATQLGGIAASQYIQTNDSRLSDPRPPTPSSPNYIQTNPNSAQSANFNISGNGTVGGALSAGTQFNLGGNRVLSISGAGSDGGGSLATSNTFTGIGAGSSNTPAVNGDGTRNTFFGDNAGNANSTGSSNAFFGTRAGKSNTLANGNSFFGPSAGVSNTLGSGNSFFGDSAGNHNTNGGSNSFFGSVAGNNNSVGQRNSFIGDQAGNANTIGSDNTLLGAETDLGSNNLTNATAIGAHAQVNQSNSLVLGSVSGVNLATADTNVGIGANAPVSRLHVKGTSWFQGDTTPLVATAGRGVAIGTGANSGNIYGYVFAFNYGANAVSDLLLNYPGGRVGIGTFNPDQTLTVNGNASKVGGGSWATFSDERLKNLKGRFTPGLRAVMQLQPLRYEYKRDNALNLKSEGEHIGFSAQAVQRIIPEAVSENDKGYLLVNNDPILWTMLNAIKEQQSQIEQQQQQIVALKKLVCRSHPRAAVCK